MANSNSNEDSRRQYRTLSSVMESFLADTTDASGRRYSGRELFNNALRHMNAEENSQAVQEILQHLERVGDLLNESEGVLQQFLDSLERVDVKTLAESADCPICTNRFVDNEWPLVVKLPCKLQGNTKREHLFDMDCIAPWLKMHSTCPLCRFDMRDVDRVRREKLAKELAEAEDDDEDDEDDDGLDLYG